MAFMDDAEIVNAISTGDSTYEEKMKLLRIHIKSIKKGERIRVANKIMDNQFWEDSQ